MSPVLRLGVYRERIEAYSARSSAHYIEGNYLYLYFM